MVNTGKQEVLLDHRRGHLFVLRYHQPQETHAYPAEEDRRPKTPRPDLEIPAGGSDGTEIVQGYKARHTPSASVALEVTPTQQVTENPAVRSGAISTGDNL